MQRVLLILALAFTSLGAFADNVPAITVEYIADGTPAYSKALNTIGKVLFSNGYATIFFADGTTQDLGALADIKKMSFGAVDENSLTPDKPDAIASANQVKLTVYPNPTANSIHVDGVAEGALIRLFTIGGQQVLATKDTDIDLSAHPEGEYILQAGACVVKIVKK